MRAVSTRRSRHEPSGSVYASARDTLGAKGAGCLSKLRGAFFLRENAARNGVAFLFICPESAARKEASVEQFAVAPKVVLGHGFTIH